MLLLFSFPHWNLYFLAYFSVVPILIISRGRLPFYYGWLAGLVSFMGLTYWLTDAVYSFGGVPFAVAVLCWICLAAYAALTYGLFTLFVSRVKDDRLMLAAPCSWVALELIRANVFTGFPFGMLGYSQGAFNLLVQVADITGVYGLSFFIVSLNVFFYLAFKYRSDYGRYLKEGVYVCLLFCMLIGYGSYRVYGDNLDERDGRDAGVSLNVGVVQGNIAQSDKWDKEYMRSTVNRYKSLSRVAVGRGADLLVWPESAMPFLFGQDDEMKQELLDFAGEIGKDILFGAPTLKGRTAGGEYLLNNSAVLVSKTGRVVDRYDKVHLVPFGEYIPLKPLLSFVKKMVFAEGEFVPGERFNLLAGGDGAGFGVLICYEMLFPEIARQYALGGADFLVTVTNDAWYGKTTAPFQLFSIGIFRAVETRLAMVRSANTGISGFIDSRGRVVAGSGIFSEAVLVEAVNAGYGNQTFYTRFGDLFAYLNLFVFAAISVRIFLWRNTGAR